MAAVAAAWRRCNRTFIAITPAISFPGILRSVDDALKVKHVFETIGNVRGGAVEMQVFAVRRDERGWFAEVRLLVWNEGSVRHIAEQERELAQAADDLTRITAAIVAWSRVVPRALACASSTILWMPRDFWYLGEVLRLGAVDTVEGFEKALLTPERLGRHLLA
jgi:hypothetical protein